ncbi:MAG: 16S rRNA (cytosine(1402)-N(4))-methyltransferase RsmH, partial [Campylobacter concisus]|nr:16S rRNA (cytosine(1402)-N(4))-methyltransferase RsmH [Campylobacter concisus]
MQSPHISVLLDEVLSFFKDLRGNFIDCTLGYAGHSSAILSQNENLNLIACDKDIEAINFSLKKLEPFGNRVKIYKSNFSELISKLSGDEILNVRGILADIGVSSLQIDKDDRGFSIGSSTLDMRMDKERSFSAYEVVNGYSFDELVRIFRDYGELKNASCVANKIINARNLGNITSAKELANIIGTAQIKGRGVSPAILAFQAIRIEVNGELDE